MCEDLWTLDGPNQKEEFPPLLPQGFHDRTLDSLGAEFLEPFPVSVTRALLLQELSRVVTDLAAKGVRGYVWLDGSFITAKVDPNDIDFLLVMESDLYDAASEDQRGVVDALMAESPICDTNVMFLFPPEVTDNQNQIDYWTRRFGRSASGTVLKGIVRIALEGGEDGNGDSNA